MPDNEIPAQLKNAIGRLVTAAEEVIRSTDGAQLKDMKTQLSQLIAVCQDAVCIEEIENYVRYQIGRAAWPTALGEAVLSSISRTFAAATLTDPKQKLQAWQRYATYLKRALVYQLAVSRSADGPTRPTTHGGGHPAPVNPRRGGGPQPNRDRTGR